MDPALVARYAWDGRCPSIRAKVLADPSRFQELMPAQYSEMIHALRVRVEEKPVANKYGAVGTPQDNNCWYTLPLASNQKFQFSNGRYPIVVNSICTNGGDMLSYEVYDNHGQKYTHPVQSKHASGGFGCYTYNSHVPPGGIFRCVSQKEYATPLSPPLIDLIKSQSIPRIIKELEGARSELESAKTEIETLKATLESAKTEIETLKAKLAGRTGLATPALAALGK
jgi:hypothetical protein